MIKEEYIERYGIDKYNRRLEYYRNRNNDSVYRESQRIYQREFHKEYPRNDLNSNGKRKDNIRWLSRDILFKRRSHTKFKGYQIHHAFGYNDPFKFIYIPKSLHIKIHKYLRDNNIDADSNHYDYIKHMINECEEYTYISV